MTITLNLAPEGDAELNYIAAQKGQDADTVAYNLFTAELAKFRARHNILEGVKAMTHEEAMRLP
jgi:hypothetical protein